MVHDVVKASIEKHDIKRLKYIFVDSLDVDPTFEDYKDDYEYCINFPGLGLFEQYIEMTPLRENRNFWDITYWKSIKMDLIKNFSQERFRHMVEVAQVVHADKIERIKKERLEEERLLKAERQRAEECEKGKLDSQNKKVIREIDCNGIQAKQMKKETQASKPQMKVNVSEKENDNVLKESATVSKSIRENPEKNSRDYHVNTNYGCTNHSGTQNSVIRSGQSSSEKIKNEYKEDEKVPKQDSIKGSDYCEIYKFLGGRVRFELSRSKETPHLRKKWVEGIVVAYERHIIAFDVSDDEHLIKKIEGSYTTKWKLYKNKKYIIYEQLDNHNCCTGYYKIENTDWKENVKYYAKEELCKGRSK